MHPLDSKFNKTALLSFSERSKLSGRKIVHGRNEKALDIVKPILGTVSLGIEFLSVFFDRSVRLLRFQYKYAASTMKTIIAIVVI